MAKDRELSDFAVWLTRRMGVLQLKNADVARATEVTGPAVSLWRTGVNVPDNDRIEDLAEILQVTPETILIKLGRMKPREGITKDWEDIITRFQDAGPEAEQLLFAIGDALLLAMNRARTQTEVTLSLDPIFNPEQLEGMRSRGNFEDAENVLFFNQIRLPNNRAIQMQVIAEGADQENHFRITAEASEDISDRDVLLKVGGATYAAEPWDDTELVFEDVLLDGSMRNVTLIVR